MPGQSWPILWRGEHNSSNGPERESDRLIAVCGKQGSTRGANAPDRECVSVDREGRCTVNGITEYTLAVFAALDKCGVREV